MGKSKELFQAVREHEIQQEEEAMRRMQQGKTYLCPQNVPRVLQAKPKTHKEIPEIDRIFEWVEEHLNDGYYNQKGIAEVIENYLNTGTEK